MYLRTTVKSINLKHCKHEKSVKTYKWLHATPMWCCSWEYVQNTAWDSCGFAELFRKLTSDISKALSFMKYLNNGGQEESTENKKILEALLQYWTTTCNFWPVWCILGRGQVPPWVLQRQVSLSSQAHHLKSTASNCFTIFKVGWLCSPIRSLVCQHNNSPINTSLWVSSRTKVCVGAGVRERVVRPWDTMEADPSTLEMVTVCHSPSLAVASDCSNTSPGAWRPSEQGLCSVNFFEWEIMH